MNNGCRENKPRDRSLDWLKVCGLLINNQSFIKNDVTMKLIENSKSRIEDCHTRDRSLGNEMKVFPLDAAHFDTCSKKRGALNLRKACFRHSGNTNRLNFVPYSQLTSRACFTPISNQRCECFLGITSRKLRGLRISRTRLSSQMSLNGTGDHENVIFFERDKR
jgi:hypothetical protein